MIKIRWKGIFGLIWIEKNWRLKEACSVDISTMFIDISPAAICFY